MWRGLGVTSPGAVQIDIIGTGGQLLILEKCSDEVRHISEVALVWK